MVREASPDARRSTDPIEACTGHRRTLQWGMRLRTLVVCACLRGVLGLGALSACGSQNNGAGPKDGGVDATTTDGGAEATAVDSGAPDSVFDAGEAAVADAEAGPPDAGPCTGVVCNGKCVQASDCHECEGAPLLCGPTATCVSACASCSDTHGTASPIECFACDSTHQNPIGTCQPADAGSYCLSGDYLGQYQGGPGYQCGCNEAGVCPGATQVCVPLGNFGAAFCLTCGEPTTGQIQGAPCKDGGTCQESQALCQ
jgi:hypothetical protein